MSRLHARAPSADAGISRVLLVADDASAADWSAFDTSGLDVQRAASVSEAAERLDRARYDVVVIHARVAANSTDATDLRAKLDHAALLVLADEFTSDTTELMQRLGAACTLPADAPDAVQAQVITLAVKHARAAAALGDRVAELERRTAELERSRARFRAVIERNADAIIVVDHMGVICFANAMAANLFRSSREDLCGSEFGFPVLVGETTELDLPHPDQIRTVEMRVVESEWEGEPAYIATLRDITERKRAEDSARSLIREQTARAVAETAAQRFRFLAEAGTRLSMPLDEAQTFSTLAQLCVTDIADWATIHVVDELGVVRSVEVAHRDPSAAGSVAMLRGQLIAEDEIHPVLDVLRSRRPSLVSEVDDAFVAGLSRDERQLEAVRTLGISSLMIVPLVARERELGAIALVSADPARRYSDDDLDVAVALAHRAALAIDSARLYREASEANRGKTDLLAVISHDLRTPLNAIMGHADLLALGIPEPLSDAGLERVERIRMSTTHLVYLIDELLAFARLDGGREELRLQDVDAGAIARDVAAVVEPLALERGLVFRVELPDGPAPMHTDPDRLRQVLLNLVGNAVKYTEAGEVCMAVTVENGLVCLVVRDTGMGIPEEHIDRIFEPFWQLDPEQRTRNGGTGLGLSVVRRLVGLLGGRIGVSSEVGRGTTFTVRLPRRHENASPGSSHVSVDP